MIIQISDTERVKGTEREWQLQRLKVYKRRGKEVREWQAYQYFSSLAGCYRALAEREVRLADDMKQAQERILELAELFADQLDIRIGVSNQS